MSNNFKHRVGLQSKLKAMENYVSKGYSGKGWNHYDSKLGEIFWPIEEATWLRLISNKELLVVDTTKFLDFLEQKFKFSTHLN